MELEVSETKKSKLYVAPCIKCGSDDIAIRDANESAFNYGGGTCKKCKHDVSGSVGIFPSKREMVAIWNNGNDPRNLHRSSELKIEKLKQEIAVEKKKMVEYRKLAKKLGLSII